MVKIAKYIKPYTLPIILAIGLLYIQVNMDLALPDYMSKIVNTGIQQEGIDSVIPDILSIKTFNSIKENLTKDDTRYLETIYSKESDSNKKLFKLNSDNKLIPNEFKTNFSHALIITTPYGAMLKSADDNAIKQATIAVIKQKYIDLGIDMSRVQTLYILKTGGIMILFTLLSVTCAILVGFIASKTAAGGARNIRSAIFNKVESFSQAEFDKFSTASLITRSTNDVNQIQQVTFMITRMVFYAPLLGIGGFIRAMGKAPSMGWIIGLAVLFLLGIIALVTTVAIPKFKVIQKLVDKVNLVARENLSGILVVRAFNRQDFEENRFDQVNKELTNTNLFVARVMVIVMPLIMLLMNALAVVIIWIGSKEVSIGAMQVGDMMAFIQYAMQIVMSFMMLSMLFIFLPRASVSAKRITDVLETEPSITDPENPEKLPEDIKREVVFDNVNFRYPGGEVDALSNISFTAKAGTTTAFIGSTGSGKSTIVNLIPRFYDVTSGSIKINGTDIRDITQFDLRSEIGLVPQKNVLFSGTIESNLKYGKKDADNNELDRVTNIAQASEFIKTKEDGYNFGISQDGSNVSGGQRQRLAISRALMKDSPIYIFDDSFSALDFKTDAALRKELKANTSDTVLLIVAQRVSTIMDADQIIVLDEGEIVGKGTHQELLKSCNEYKEIATSQLGLQE